MGLFNGFVIISADEVPPPSNSDASTMFDSPKSPEDINKDRYNLISGVCLEALCSQFVMYSDEDFRYCLCTVQSLLETAFGRQRLTQQKVYL